MVHQHSIKPPPYSRRRVIQRAEELTRRYLEINPDGWLAIGFDVVYDDLIYPEYEIEFVDDIDLGFDGDGEKILGKFDPERNIAYVDLSLHPTRKDPRRAFTCWHEVGGHGILQGDWLRAESRRLHLTEPIVTTESAISIATLNVLERQANLFAAHAAAPSWLLDHAIRDTFCLTRPIRYIGPGKYSLSVRGKTRLYDIGDWSELCRVVAYQIQWRFGGLSVESLSYRVAESSHLTDRASPGISLYRKARTPRPSLGIQFQTVASILGAAP